MCIAPNLWLASEGVTLNIASSKNVISDIERFHKTVYEKLRIITSEI